VTAEGEADDEAAEDEDEDDSRGEGSGAEVAEGAGDGEADKVTAAGDGAFDDGINCPYRVALTGSSSFLSLAAGPSGWNLA
jgi:hypothetical protein